MSTSRRSFIREMGVGLATLSTAASALAQGGAQASGSERLLVPNPLQPEPAPVGYDRLPLDWYKAASRRLKNRLASRNVDAILLQSDSTTFIEPGYSGRVHASGNIIIEATS